MRTFSSGESRFRVGLKAIYEALVGAKRLDGFVVRKHSVSYSIQAMRCCREAGLNLTALVHNTFLACL